MKLLRVSASPHLHGEESTRTLMLDVLIALLPSLIWGIYLFGWRALSLTLLSVLSCVAFEALYNLTLRRPIPVGDLSAVVTGVLLAFCLPASLPYPMVIIGAFFAIVIVKGLFGGLGKNIVNPALAARIFLFISFPSAMTTYPSITTKLPIFGALPDAVSSATPLSTLKAGSLPTESALNLLFGSYTGCLGEVSALLLLAGGLYLLSRKVIDPRIPLSCLLTVAALTFFFPQGDVKNSAFMVSQLLSGGLILGAVFMATDYVTSPTTPLGRIIYGVLIGALTVFIRYFGGYPEGVSFAILIMNLFVYYLDRYTRATPFGKVKKGGAKKHGNKENA